MVRTYRPKSTIGLLAHMPPCADELPAWFDSLDDKRLDAVWVASCATLILEDDKPDIASIVRALNVVRERYRTNLQARQQHPARTPDCCRHTTKAMADA